MVAEFLLSCQDKTLARLPKLLAKLEECRWEMAQLKELNSMLIVQVENEAEQVRYAILRTIQDFAGSAAKKCCVDMSLPNKSNSESIGRMAKLETLSVQSDMACR